MLGTVSKANLRISRARIMFGGLYVSVHNSHSIIPPLTEDFFLTDLLKVAVGGHIECSAFVLLLGNEVEEIME